MKRWEFYWADLNFPAGSEQGGELSRVLVVPNDGFNEASSLVTIVSLTRLEGKQRKVYTHEVRVPEEILSTGFSGILMPQQIRTISKDRLLERIGSLHDVGKREEIINRLLEHLDIEFEAELPSAGDNHDNGPSYFGERPFSFVACLLRDSRAPLRGLEVPTTPTTRIPCCSSHPITPWRASAPAARARRRRR